MMKRWREALHIGTSLSVVPGLFKAWRALFKEDLWPVVFPTRILNLINRETEYTHGLAFSQSVCLFP